VGCFIKDVKNRSLNSNTYSIRFQLKVLQVIDRLEAGGAERVFLDLTKLLLDKKIHVDTLTISAKGVLFGTIDTRATHYFLDRRNKFSVKKMLECASLCSKYDIIHVHMRHTYAYIRLSQLISNRKYKILFHDHYGDIHTDTRVPFTLRLLFKPTFYIGVSTSLRNWAIKQLRIDPKQTWVMRNTIIPYERKTEAVKNNKWVIVSNIRPSKNIEFAIGFSHEHNESLDIFGQLSGDEYSERILEMVRAHKEVTLYTNEFDIQAKLQNYALAIHVAHSESGPLVLMEYLIQGLPFLAHKTGEVADVLYPELPECFVDNLEKHEWNRKLELLKSNMPDEKKLKNLFYKYFGPEQYSNQCIQIYQQVVNS
jgi:glycosyltransferase involved in cell wall biosynthesis